MHAAKQGTTFLLVGNDQSSTCLACHLQAGTAVPNSYLVATADADMPIGSPPHQRTPGGDFGWLHKNYTYTVTGAVTNESGDDHGHNVIAADYGYRADATYSTAPGGSMPASQLACNSCHDPHGEYRRTSTGHIVTTGATIIGSGSYNTSPGNSTGNPLSNGQAVGVYRLLGGNGYSNSQSGLIGYPGVPAAVAPSTYNQSETTNQVRVAYGVSTSNGQATWSYWCATCHPNMHSSGNYVHPVDTALYAYEGNYSRYVSSGKMTGSFAGSQAGQGPYTSLVPFMENNGNYTTLGSHANNTGAYLNGPSDGDQVTCLSCHRAHASGWPKALRWNNFGDFITYVVDGTTTPAWPGTDTTPGEPQYAMGRLSVETQAAYYDRNVLVFGAYQRVLCNKCHALD
jgi:hypothetical protein